MPYTPNVLDMQRPTLNDHNQVMALLASLPDEDQALNQLVNDAGQKITYLTDSERLELRVQNETDARQAVRRWGERRNRLKHEYRARRLFHALYNRAYEGCVLESADTGSNKIEPIGLPGWFPDNSLHRVEFPRLRPIVNEIQAELTTPRGRLEVNARSSSQRDLDGARAANKLVWYLHERKEMRGLEAQVALAGIIYGECYIKSEWDQRRVVCVKDADDKVVRGMFGDVRFSSVSPGRLYVDPSAKCLEQAEWVIEERILSRTELERSWPAGAEYIKPQAPDHDEWDDDDERYYFWDAQSDLEEAIGGQAASMLEREPTYRVYECYEKSFDENVGYIWHRTIICRGYILERGIYQPLNGVNEPVIDIYGNEVFWDLPYVHWRYNEVMERFHGQGVMRDALKPARFLSWLDSLMAKIGSDSALKIMVLPMEATNTSVYKQGLIEYRVADKSDTPQFLDTGNYPAIILEQVRYYNEMLREVTMRPDVVRGEAPANRSGKAINTLSAEAKGMFDAVRRRFDEAWMTAFEQALRIASVMYVETRILGINEDDGAGSFTLKGIDFQNHADVRMDYTPFIGHTRAERTDFMLQMLQFQVYTPQEVKQIIKAGNNEEIVEMSELQMRRGREAIYAIQDMKTQELAEIARGLDEARASVEAKVQTGEVGLDQMKQSLIEAQNDVLMTFDLGIDTFDDPGLQAVEVKRAALMNRFKTMNPAARAILTLRYDMCMDMAAAKMASVQTQMQPQA